MIRDMLRNGAQPKDTMHRAEVALKTGMGVVIKSQTHAGLPTEETASNVRVATKERIPVGCHAAKRDMSDYHEDFINIKKDELFGLECYTDGEKFATDQFVAADFVDDLAWGTAVSVGTDGLWKKATIESKFIFAGYHIDNGHKLVMIKVEKDAVANA